MKAIAAVALCALVAWTGLPSTAVLAKEKASEKLVDQVKSAVLMEKDTGTVLYSQNADDRLPPASMTKIMTLLLIFKALDAQDISLKDKVRISEHAASMGGSQVFLEPGETMTVRDLIKAIAIASANDASVAMAEYIAGSEQAFVKKMNDEAKRLGLKNTHFKNPTGLSADGHYSSARDMALMARALLRYPEVLKFTSIYEDYLRENTDNKFWLVNTNKMIKTYPGVDGLKTGFTQEAKYCLTATAMKNGMRVIAVVMGAPTTKVRNEQVAKMLDHAFNAYKTKKLMDSGRVVRLVPVNKSEEGKVPAVTRDPVVLLLKRGEAASHLKTSVHLTKGLKAPLKAGSVVGHVSVKKGNVLVSQTPLIVTKDIKPASWWQLFKRNIGKMTSGSW